MSTVNLIPNSDISVQLSLSSGSNPHYTYIDDPVGSPDDETTYVTNQAGGVLKDIYGLPDTALSGTITNVRIMTRTHRASSTNSFRIVLVENSVTSYSDSFKGASNAWYDIYRDYAVRPSDSSSWTWDDINSLQVGIEITRATGIPRCTQLYVIVTYEITANNYEIELSDSTILSDTIKKDFVKITNDNIILSDNKYFDIEKNITNENITVSDDKYFDIEKNISSDIIALLDDIEVVRILNLSDSVNLSDSINKDIEKIINNGIVINDSFSRIVDYIRTDSDVISLSDSISKEVDKPLADNISLSDSLAKSIGFNRNISDSVELSDSLILTYVESFEYAFKIDAGGTSIVLHKPYYYGAIGGLEFNYNNMTFRNRHYASHIEDISDERFEIRGYDYDGALDKMILLSGIADDGTEIEVQFMGSWNGVYIIESIAYTPIGIASDKDDDVWEYRMILKYVSE